MVKRILHVVGCMNRGGIETWLMHILRHIDRDRIQMDFLVHTTDKGAYDDEIYKLGSQIIPCLSPSKPWLYASNFEQILRQHGRYDIVHSHVHCFSGYILRLAHNNRVPFCIAHSHNDTSVVESQSGLSRKLYTGLTKSWINRYANLGLGCSRQAAADLFGSDWHRDSRWQILNYGIDLNVFDDFVDTTEVRAELGIPSDAFVIGHVGRFQEQKNHHFLLDIAAQIIKKEPKTYVLLIGDGVMLPEIEHKALQLGLAERVIFTGSRPDVPRLMRGAMDVFIFPSCYEGLGIVLIEAQAAGLPCIYSDVVPEEADVVKVLLRRLSLSQPASTWAEAVLEQKYSASRIAQVDALKIIKKSPFNINASVQHLQNIYQAEFIREAVA